MSHGHEDFRTAIILQGVYSGQQIPLNVDEYGRILIKRIELGDFTGDHRDLTHLDAYDHDQYLRRDLADPLTASALRREVNTEHLHVRGGDENSGSGGGLYVYGVDDETYKGGVLLVVPNAAKTADLPLMTVIGTSNTPNVQWAGGRMLNVADPTLPQDVATKNYVDTTETSLFNAVYAMVTALIGQVTTLINAVSDRVTALENSLTATWSAWTPNITWSGNAPAGAIVTARYLKSGKLVRFYIHIFVAATYGVTGLRVNMPAAMYTGESYHISLTAAEYSTGASPVACDPVCYAMSRGLASEIQCAAFQAVPYGQDLFFSVGGVYEAAN